MLRRRRPRRRCDALIDQTVPGEHPARSGRWSLPPAVDEHELLEELEALAAKNQVFRSFIGHGLLRHHHPAGHPAQRPPEPGLVHPVHAVPGGDRPGPAGGAAQLPDDGDGPHRAADRQRLAARRGHRGRRGDASAPGAGEGRRARRVLRLRRLPPADDRGGADARRRRSASRWWSAMHRTFDFSSARSSARWCSTRRPTARCEDLPRLLRQGPRGGRRRRRGHRPPRAHAAHARRASSARTSRSAARSASACRMGYGGPHAAFFATKQAFTRAHAGPHHRRVRGRARQPRAAHGAADPRAAHPPREGDEQHLHRAGAARGHGQHVRRLPRARRGSRPSPSACTGSPCALARGLGKLGVKVRSTRAFFDTLRLETEPRRGRPGRWPRARDAEDEPPAHRRHAPSASRSTRPPAPRTSRRCWSVFAQGRVPSRWTSLGGAGRGGRRPRGRRRSPARARTSRTRSSTATTPRRRCCATSSGWRRRTFAHALDDPAGHLHDEAQRHRGDDPGHLARVRPAAPVRAARRRPRATSSSSEQLERMLAEITGFAAVLAAAQRRHPGRVRGPAGHPRVPREPRPGRTATSASSPPRRTAPTPRRAVMAGYQGRGRQVRRGRATSTSADLRGQGRGAQGPARAR